MPTPPPFEFSQNWVQAWNEHDVEAVLAHFDDKVVFSSPVAAQVVPESGGVLRGKAALRDYWRKGLAMIPDLRFVVEAVYAGLDVLVINYRNQKNNLVNEVLIFQDGLVVAGYGTYPDGEQNPAGVRS